MDTPGPLEKGLVANLYVPINPPSSAYYTLPLDVAFGTIGVSAIWLAVVTAIVWRSQSGPECEAAKGRAAVAPASSTPSSSAPAAAMPAMLTTTMPVVSTTAMMSSTATPLGLSRSSCQSNREGGYGQNSREFPEVHTPTFLGRSARLTWLCSQTFRELPQQHGRNNPRATQIQSATGGWRVAVSWPHGWIEYITGPGSPARLKAIAPTLSLTRAMALEQPPHWRSGISAPDPG